MTTAQVTDLNGNQSALATQLVTVAETGPSVTIDKVDGNDLINFAEAHAAAGVALTGTVTGLAAGSLFNVMVADNGVTNTYIATVNDAGTGWTATIPTAWMRRRCTMAPLTVTAQVAMISTATSRRWRPSSSPWPRPAQARDDRQGRRQ